MFQYMHDKVFFSKGTRSSGQLSVCPIFGKPTDKLPTNYLPTKKDVLLRFFKIRDENNYAKNVNSKDTVREISKPIAKELKEIWGRYFISEITMGEIDIEKNIADLFNGSGKNSKSKCYSNLKKKFNTYSGRNNNEKALQKFDEEIREFAELFDIFKCQKGISDPKLCVQLKNCEICKLLDKEDQESLLRARCGEIIKMSSKVKTCEDGEIDDDVQYDNPAPSTSDFMDVDYFDETTGDYPDQQSDSDIEDEEEDEKDSESDQAGISSGDDPTWEPEKSQIEISKLHQKEIKVPSKNYLDITNFAISIINGGRSNERAAMDANGLVLDLMKKYNKVPKLHFTKSKLHRRKKDVRAKFLLEHLRELQKTTIRAIYFDSKKEEQIINEKNAMGTNTSDTRIEDHYTVVLQPENKFITSVSVVKDTDEKAMAIATKKILEFFDKMDLGENLRQNLIAAACDGTNSNTGWQHGIIRRLEEELERPLHWNVCILHLIELVLSNLLKADFMLGKKEKLGFTSVLGKDITNDNLHQREVVDFKKIQVNDFPDFTQKSQRSELGLRGDQDYLYKICLAIMFKTDEYIKKIKDYKLGQIGHARWLSTADRILRIYISTIEPDMVLSFLAQFIVGVYAPVFFNIKKNSSFAKAPVLYHEIIKRTQLVLDNFSRRNLSRKLLAKQVKENVEKTMGNNSYWAHPENILTAMLASDDLSTKHEGIRLIEAARKNRIEYDGKIKKLKRLTPYEKMHVKVRVFQKPKETDINFKAEKFYQLVDLKANIYEPPMTINVEDLMYFEIPKLPNNTQGVEFFVQEVHSESSKVTKDNARNANVIIKDYVRKAIKNEKGIIKGYSGKLFDLPNDSKDLIEKYFPVI